MQQRPSRVAASLQRAKNALSQRVVSEAIQSLPANVTMGDLVDEFNQTEFKEQFRAMTLADFVAATGASKKKASSGKGRAIAAGSSWRTRTEAGRKALEDAIKEVLAPIGTLGAEAIRKQVGGTADQIRKALARLRAQGVVSRQGEKRSTTYTYLGEGGGKASSGAKSAGGRRSSSRKKASKKKAKKKTARK